MGVLAAVGEGVVGVFSNDVVFRSELSDVEERGFVGVISVGVEFEGRVDYLKGGKDWAESMYI